MTDTNTAQLVLDLQANDEAVRANGWVAPGLGVPGAPLSMLTSTLNPLGGLAAAGLSWFMPLVSFLGDGLTQLQGGNGASVSSGSQDFGGAGQDIAGVADSYRASTSAQTSNWSGAAASEYREAGAQHADGIAGLGQASNGVGSAIIGAGQVVAQAIAEVTELIAEAVAQIVPIMTQAIARAAETFGQSVVEAIPPCVGIAVEYALRIAAKLAALLASGDNLLKLVQGGMAVVDLISQALSGISQQSVQSGAEPQSTAAAAQPGGGPASTKDAVDAVSAKTSGDPAGTGGTSPMSSAGGPSTSGGATTPTATHSWTSPASPVATNTAGAVPLNRGSTPGESSSAGNGGGSARPLPTGALPTGAAGRGPAAGARVGAGTARQEDAKQQPARAVNGGSGGGGAPGAMPMGAMGGRPGGDADKEHKRKFNVVQLHDEDLEVAPQVITSTEVKG